MYRGICHNNNIKDGKRQLELKCSKILVQKPCHPSPGLSSCSALGPRSLSLDTAACSAGACDGPVKARPWDLIPEAASNLTLTPTSKKG